MAASLSLMMIVRDESKLLGRILGQAADVCDEMVVVDTGSVDDTRDIARAAGAKVLEFDWIDDFAAARNVALEACRGDWLIWLDADDVLTPEVRSTLREAKNNLMNNQLDAIMAPYHSAFPAEGGDYAFTLYRERLARAQPGLRWTGAIHETLTIPGDRIIRRDDLYVEHRSDPDQRPAKSVRNLRIVQAEAARAPSPRTLFYLGNELLDAGRLTESLEAYERYLLAPGIEWEHYAVLMNMATIHDRLNQPERKIEMLTRATLLDPGRSPAWLSLGWPYFERGEWAKALPLYAAAAASRQPIDGFVFPSDYTWRPLDFLGVCLANLGRHPEAIGATRRALELGHPDQDRLRANLTWSLQQSREPVTPTQIPNLMMRDDASLPA